jgi:hypothetical protein
MAIVSEAVANAKSDIARLGPEIETWTDYFLELFDNVTHLDLVFEEAGKMDLNYVALCDWNDSSRLEVIHTIPAKQTADQRKKTLAMTSVIVAMLHTFGHLEVAVALLADEVGKAFRHEGVAGRSRPIRGCGRVPAPHSQSDFSAIPGHVLHHAAITWN